jgi:titin
MWEDSSGDELGFKIERREGSKGIYKERAVVGPNVTTFTDTGLNPGTTYYYRVRSYNTYGESEYSDEIRVKVSGQ